LGQLARGGFDESVGPQTVGRARRVAHRPELSPLADQPGREILAETGKAALWRKLQAVKSILDRVFGVHLRGAEGVEELRLNDRNVFQPVAAPAQIEPRK
jgi:hypothetical protein